MQRNQVQLYILDQRVDLYNGESIVVESKIQDIRDVKKVFTDYTHSFKIPASKNNNKILQHLLRPETTGLDPRAYHEAYIEVDNNIFKRGYVLIIGGSYKSGSLNSYEVRFFGGLVSLSRVIGDDFLGDIDGLRDDLLSALSFDSLSDRDQAIMDFHTNETADTDDITICLNSYADGYFYDSSGTDEGQIRDGYRNIYYGNSTNNNLNHNGYDLDLLRVSYRSSKILEAIENHYIGEDGRKLIQFSRGFDANGLPTADPTLVSTGSHFLNNRRFTDMFMLMHSKVDSESLDTRPVEDVKFSRVWPNMIASSPGVSSAGANFGGTYLNPSSISELNTDTSFYAFVDEDESGDIRSSEYFIDATINGTGEYELYLWDLRDERKVWSTGITSGTFQSSNVTTGEQAYKEIRDAESGGSNQGNPSGLSPGSGQKLLFESLRGSHELVFRLQKSEGSTVSVGTNGIKIVNSVRSKTGIFSNFELNTLSVGNSFASGAGEAGYVIQHRVPRIKVLDFISGIWKMFNLTAEVMVDANGNDIIVTQELDSYYNQGTTIDLTEYTNNQDYDTTSPVFFNPIIFKYKNPTTYLAKEFYEDIGNRNSRRYGYGSLSYDSEDAGLEYRLPYKEYKVELPFETVVLSGIVDLAENDSTGDLVYGWIVNESRSETSPAPILHYVENVTPSVSMLGKDNANQPVEITTYNALTKSLIRDFNEIQSLTFGEENIERLSYALAESTSNDSSAVKTNVTLFSNLYRRYINRIFNDRARLYSFDAVLPKRVISEINLADEVIIGNSSYRINNIGINLDNGKSSLELISLDDSVVDVDAPQVIEFVGPFSVSISQEPEPSDGLNVNFIASAEGGDGDYSFTWFINDVEQSSTTNIMTAPTVSSADVIRVEATSALLLAADEFSPRINSQPSVFISSSISTINVGDNVTLTAAVSDEEGDLFVIQWYRNDAAIPGATTTSYNVSSWTTDDNGTYSAVVTSLTGNVIPTTSNELFVSTTTVSASINTLFNTGELNATLSVSPTDTMDSSATFTYRWIETSDHSNVLSTDSSLLVDTDGTYSITIESSTGSLLTLMSSVDVNEPIMTTLSGPANAAPGENITLEVSIVDTDGDLTSVVITQDGTEIYSETTAPASGELAAVGFGTYILTAEDDRGHSSTDTLVVQETTSVMATTNDFVADDGDTIVLSATGSNISSYQWQEESGVILNTDDYYDKSTLPAATDATYGQFYYWHLLENIYWINPNGTSSDTTDSWLAIWPGSDHSGPATAVFFDSIAASTLSGDNTRYYSADAEGFGFATGEISPDRVEMFYGTPPEYVFNNIPGETGNTYSFNVAVTTDLASAEDKANLYSYDDVFNTNLIGYNVLVDDFNDGNQNRITYGLPVGTTTGSAFNTFIAFYSDGVDHSTATPIASFDSSFAGGHSQWNGATVSLFPDATQHSNLLTIADATGTQFSNNSPIGIADANFELWTGIRELPAITSGVGTYRVVVTSPSGTEVISNAIEIT